MLFLDIETADDRLVCVGWAVGAGPVQAAPSFPAEVRARLADANEVVVTHSGYDVRFLHFNEGADIQCQMHDTQVMAWLVNETTPLDLAFCAQRYLGQTLDKSLQKKAATAPYADIEAYCKKDVDVTRRLYANLKRLLEGEGLWDYFDVTEAPFTKTLRDMEFRGLPVDLPDTQRLADRYRARMRQNESMLKSNLPDAFNIRAPQQVAKYLASDRFLVKDRLPHADNVVNATLDKLAGNALSDGWASAGVPNGAPAGTFVTVKEGRLWDHGFWVAKGIGPPGTTDVSLDSVARPVLLDNPALAQNPWVSTYLQFKKYDKVVGTYLDVFQERASGGRIYGRFNQTGTATGRLSSSEPNLQNIPSRGAEGSDVRSLFKGNLVVGDFSQLEPRLMAHFSQDPGLMAAFAAGRDLYSEVAGRVGCTRAVAKTLVLAMSYGAGAEKVASTLRLNGSAGATKSKAAALLTRMQTEFHDYFLWREKVIARSKTDGYVSTIDGRRRRLDPTTNSFSWKDPAAPGRQAANAVVQGSAADIVRRVMLHTTKMFPELRLLAQVHDELVWEYDPPLASDLLTRLQKWVLQIANRGVSVPLVFEPHAGPNWYKAKEGKP